MGSKQSKPGQGIATGRKTKDRKQTDHERNMKEEERWNKAYGKMKMKEVKDEEKRVKAEERTKKRDEEKRKREEAKRKKDEAKKTQREAKGLLKNNNKDKKPHKEKGSKKKENKSKQTPSQNQTGGYSDAVFVPRKVSQDVGLLPNLPPPHTKSPPRGLSPQPRQKTAASPKPKRITSQPPPRPLSPLAYGDNVKITRGRRPITTPFVVYGQSNKFWKAFYAILNHEIRAHLSTSSQDFEPEHNQHLRQALPALTPSGKHDKAFCKNSVYTVAIGAFVNMTLKQLYPPFLQDKVLVGLEPSSTPSSANRSYESKIYKYIKACCTPEYVFAVRKHFDTLPRIPDSAWKQNYSRSAAGNAHFDASIYSSSATSGSTASL